MSVLYRLLLRYLILLAALAVCASYLAQAPGTGPVAGLSAAEIAELQAQSALDNPRLHFRLLNSRFNPRSSLWSALDAELDAFGEQQYEALLPQILEQDIPGLQRAIAQKQFSYTQLTQFYLYRIRLYEQDNAHYLNALISLNSMAVDTARERDRQVASGAVVPDPQSVFGMPVLLKDNIGFAGLPTTAGAVVLQDNFAANAFITERLEAQGAIILGKANLSEWAYYFCDACPLGYSAMGGQTLNPYGRKIIESGGSSSGSAVAVAANYAVAAVGTETSGSILSPSSLNSVVGLKPTTGMLSRYGIVPISSTLDTPGPITRNVTDAVILFNAMSGFDQRDLAMPMLSADVHLQIQPGVLTGRRLGVFDSLVDNASYAALLDVLRGAGAELVIFEGTTTALSNFSNLLGGEMKRDLAHYLEQLADSATLVQTADDVRRFNQMDLELRAPYGQGRFDFMAQLNLTESELQTAQAEMQATALALLETPLVELRLDALVSMNNVHAGYAALANYPAITVPAGLRDNGEPLGLTFIAPGFAEQILVDLALAFEAVRQGRVLPADYQ